MGGHRAERGAGSVLVVTIMGAVVAATLLLASVATALVTARSVAGAADASALAAADARAGFSADPPCAAAAVVASANDVRVVACDVDGLVVTVAVATSYMGLSIVQAATAGPPSSRPD